jgi:hypothetical protein
MSGKGNCYDNSMVETFFKSIKAELIRRNRWDTRRQAEGAIFQYINGFYNPRRRHSSLSGKSPLAFERKAALWRYRSSFCARQQTRLAVRPGQKIVLQRQLSDLGMQGLHINCRFRISFRRFTEHPGRAPSSN